jgi:hypothetical protein
LFEDPQLRETAHALLFKKAWKRGASFMSSFENKKRRQPHLRISEDASESQVLIALGEEALERIHQVSHRIEEHVQKLLHDSSYTFCSLAPDQPDHFLSTRHAEDEQDKAEGTVDNPKRRW